MRDIHFRAKPCYDGIGTASWVYGTFEYIAQRRIRPGATDNGEFEPRQDKGIITDIYGVKTEVLCDTVGQFTGCLDKAKNRIYEGDIVECVSWNEYFSSPETGDVMEPFRRRMYVAFRNGGFKLVEPMPYGLEDHVWDIIYNGDVKIVGNMIDNPELIKKTFGHMQEDPASMMGTPYKTGGINNAQAQDKALQESGGLHAGLKGIDLDSDHFKDLPVMQVNEREYEDLEKGLVSAKGVAVSMAYEQGRADMYQLLMKDAFSCRVEWMDGLYLNYTQEQQDAALEKICAAVGNEVKVAIIKEGTV